MNRNLSTLFLSNPCNFETKFHIVDYFEPRKERIFLKYHNSI